MKNTVRGVDYWDLFRLCLHHPHVQLHSRSSCKNMARVNLPWQLVLLNSPVHRVLKTTRLPTDFVSQRFYSQA